MHTGLPIRERIHAILSTGATPHPYRRIRRDGQGFRLALKEWRVSFRLDGQNVLVDRISSGYRTAQLTASGDPVIDLHRAFRLKFCP